MPTKTRLDPTAGGETRPAGQDGAQGSGRGDNSTSVGAAAAPSDVAGFIDSLTALAAHLREREAMEAEARRGWTRRAVACGALAAIQAVLALFVLAWLAAYSTGFGYYVSPLVPGALVLLSLGSAFVSFALHWRLGAAPLRRVPDSADRVALRHEDSPLRDRIRISQWVLFDTAFLRFALAEGALRARAAGAVLAVSVWGTAAIWGILMAAVLIRPNYSYYPLPPATPSPWDGAFLAVAVVFVVVTIFTVFLVRRAAFAEFARAQHYGRQVLAFDEAFGGFLPRAERDRVMQIVSAGGGDGTAAASD